MPIVDLLCIPDFMVIHLHARVLDFIWDGRWVLEDHFRARFSNLCFRIEKIVISPVADYLVCPYFRDERVSCKATYSRMFHDIP